MRDRIARAAPLVAVLLVMAYGSLLRFEVFVERYGALDHPFWARALTQKIAPSAQHLRPSVYRWPHVDRPYEGGDPINYLKYAREMRSFYQAHVREPIFLALTRLFLWLLGDQDAAVSFASATGSILIILAGYLLGSAMLSPAAGFVLSFILAIEYDLISWSVDGWRDDTFTAAVTFSAWAFVRCQRTPSLRNGALAGTATAFACLTRITALSFVLPALVWLIVDSNPAVRRERAKAAAVAVAVCTLLVAPYLISCAIATGDPLYAINYHTGYYRYGEGLPSEKPMSAMAYIGSKVGRQPVFALDTAVTGLFVHPFEVKWTGLDGWIPGLGALLSSLSIIGMVGWLFVPAGRLMFVILVGSLVPYALTWNVAGGGEWRFTMHVYPLYLLASMSGGTFAWQGIKRVWARSWRGWLTLAHIVKWGLATAVMAALYVGYVALPWFVVREKVASEADVSVETGGRDAAFFGSGWSRPYRDGLTFRVSTAGQAVVRIPLTSQRPYQIVLRLDPVSPEQQHRAVVLLNRQLLATLILTWNPDRVGSYPLQLPADKVRIGMNELTIVPDRLVPAASAGSRYTFRDPDDLLGVRLWYVRVLAPSGV